LVEIYDDQARWAGGDSNVELATSAASVDPMRIGCGARFPVGNGWPLVAGDQREHIPTAVGGIEGCPR
jgi:hypothetical protein